MNQVNKQYVAEQQAESLFGAVWAKALNRCQQFEPLKLIWWCLAVCVLSGTITRYASHTSGFFYSLMVLLGSGGCAWFWLLSRTLFREQKSRLSAVTGLVPAVILIEAMEALMSPSATTASEFSRVFSNVASMVCIAAIVGVWIETLHGFSQIRAKQERCFRIVFLVVFSIPVGIAVVWVMGAQAETFAAEWNNALLTFCAGIGVVGSRLAVEYRLRTSQTSAPQGMNQAADQQRLAQQVLQAMNDDELLTQPHLKVSDLADHLATHEYKVTRCITQQLSYRNFNHLVNHHRIERAMIMLRDPDQQHRQVATIAFDCGFNSLGPFNRAFKQHTGMTPRAYRQKPSKPID